MIRAIRFLLTATLIMQATVSSAQGTEKPTDSIRYFLWGGTLQQIEKMRVCPISPKTNTPALFKVRSMGVGEVYSPVFGVVNTSFETDGYWTVMIESEGRFFCVTDLSSTKMKKGDLVRKGSHLGKTTWNDEAKSYQIFLLVYLKNRKPIEAGSIEKYLQAL